MTICPSVTSTSHGTTTVLDLTPHPSLSPAPPVPVAAAEDVLVDAVALRNFASQPLYFVTSIRRTSVNETELPGVAAIAARIQSATGDFVLAGGGICHRRSRRGPELGG
jgi:hypothetical protein